MCGKMVVILVIAIAATFLGTSRLSLAQGVEKLLIPPEETIKEAQTKVARVRNFLKEKGFDGLLITQERNFEWVTGGKKAEIVISREACPVKLLIMKDEQYVVSPNNESSRVTEEELPGLGYKLLEFPWHDKDESVLGPFTSKNKICCDSAYPGATEIKDFYQLYYPLTETEIKKLKWLGRVCVGIVEEVARQVKPGQTENDVKAMLTAKFAQHNINPTVQLIGADARLMKYRHSVATDNPIKNYLMIIICAKKWGQIVAFTRSVHFGPVPEDGRKKFEAATRVMAAELSASKPGTTLGEILNVAMKTYETCGFPGEWRLHHQGGPMTYMERDIVSTPNSSVKLGAGSCVAYNPTVQGWKNEDTYLVTDEGVTNITPCINWPTFKVTEGGVTYTCADMLVR
jgi:Xaa-Pro aminopeptidase